MPETQDWSASGEDQRMSHNFLMTEWAKAHEGIWGSVVAAHGGHPDAFQWGTWDFFDWAVGKAWYTIGSISKARKFGWMRYDDSYDTWIETFRSFENAGILPRREYLMSGGNRTAVELLPNPADIVQARALRLADVTDEKNCIKSAVVEDMGVDTGRGLGADSLNGVE